MQASLCILRMTFKVTSLKRKEQEDDVCKELEAQRSDFSSHTTKAQSTLSHAGTHLFCVNHTPGLRVPVHCTQNSIATKMGTKLASCLGYNI